MRNTGTVVSPIPALTSPPPRPAIPRASYRIFRYITAVNFALEHLGLAARDPAALTAWYQHVLDAKLLLSNPSSPPAFMLALPGGALIEFYPAASSPHASFPNSTPGWRHVALRVDSIEAARQTLAERGVSFSESVKPAGWGGRVLFFSDPEGNLLHLVERPGAFPP